MKIVSLVLATTVAAVIGSVPVWAESAGTSSGAAPQSGSVMKAPTHPGPNRWDRDREWYQRPGWLQGGYGGGWMGPRRMMSPHAGWMMGPRAGWMGGHAGWQHHRRARGARFTFTRGNARVDIQCPANQSLKDCVDAASTLIDKVTRMGPPPPPPPGQPKPPAGTNGHAPVPGGSPKPGDKM